MSTSIFLADDDEDDCMLFEDALKEVDLDVDLTVINDGEALMRALNKQVPPAPQVIFLDLNMPRKNGFECLQEIKQSEKLKDIPVVIFSTSTQEESINKAFLQGADHYIFKPGTFQLLKKTIRKVLSINWRKESQTTFKDFLLHP
ncbi:MAG: response regulator [Marivirga sp.]|nr:response regulator [Marivirga sp.]